MARNIDIIGTAKKVIVKIGSSILTDNDAKSPIRHAWLDKLAQDIMTWQQQKKQIVIVTSGSIVLGRSILKYYDKNFLKLEEKQAAAAAGQSLLMRAYENALAKFGLQCAQILLTLEDTEQRRRHLNARATIHELLSHNIIPIINENDTIATDEIRYGDNDRLAARIATMISADLLIMLSDVDGLYDRNPQQYENAKHISYVNIINKQIEDMAGEQTNPLSNGGMITKIAAAKIAVNGGCHALIANGHKEFPLSTLTTYNKATAFIAIDKPQIARKKWIQGSIHLHGVIMIDDGAVQALKAGKSLLPAGVVQIDGHFQRGDTVAIHNIQNQHIATGLTNYDSRNCSKIIGLNSQDIAKVLGNDTRTTLIHRDDMSML